jgi:hypothetical protein
MASAAWGAFFKAGSIGTLTFGGGADLGADEEDTGDGLTGDGAGEGWEVGGGWEAGAPTPRPRPRPRPRPLGAPEGGGALDAFPSNI